MAIPKINHEYEAKKDQAKKLIAAGGCHAIQFWSRTDAQRLCPEGYEDFPPIEAPIYSSEWVEAAKKAIQLIRTGLQILEPPPASAEDEAKTLYPMPEEPAGYAEVYTLRNVRGWQQEAHITCARMYTGEIERLKAEAEQSLLLYNNQTATIFKLEAENSKMRELLTKIEGIARRFGNSGTNPEKDIEVIEKLATEAIKTT